MKATCSTALKRAALVLPLMAGTAAYAADRSDSDMAKPIQLAQAQPQEDPAARKRREDEQKRRQPQPGAQQPPQTPQQQQRRPEGQPPRAQRPEQRPDVPKRDGQPPRQQQGNQQPPQPNPRQGNQPPQPNQRQQQQQGNQQPGTQQQTPPGRRAIPPSRQAQPNQVPAPNTAPNVPPGQDPTKRTQPSILKPNVPPAPPAARSTTPAVPNTPVVPNTPPPQPQPRTTEGQRVPPAGGPGAAGRAGVPAPAVQNVPAVQGLPQPLPRSQRANVAPPRFDQVQQKRETRVEAGGKRTVITEGGNRTIIKQDNRVFIRHDESERFKRIQNARSIPLANGGSQTFYVRPDGFRVVSEVDRNGGLLRRYRRGPDGREFNIIDNRRFWRNAAIGVGVGVIATAVILNLRSPTVSIPRDRYIVDYGRVDDDVLFETLSAPPVDRPERVYSLEEVRYNYQLREHMRSIDLDDINFEFGAFEVTPDQYNKLERLAKLINRVLGKNPDEVFMIEGHTDAVGSDVDNLSLSDRRAQSVAQILSEQYGIPPENLVTQGYGEQFLKVKTQEAERVNRRVTLRRITPLIAEKG